MIKKFFKELFIAILIVAALLLIFTICFYETIPINKVVPEDVAKYSLPDEVQTEINEQLHEEQKVIVTYNLDGQGLDDYKKNNLYNPRKS